MKKYFFLFALCVATLFVGLVFSCKKDSTNNNAAYNCPAENTTPTDIGFRTSKQDYLKKSKGQKTAAWICLGIGVACLASVAPGDVTFDILPVLVIGGGALIVSSIPLFIVASGNKRKSKTTSAFLKMESAPVMKQSGTFSRPFPAVSVKISL